MIMKCTTFLSLLLAFTLVAGLVSLPAARQNNYGVAVCEENPLEFITNDD